MSTAPDKNALLILGWVIAIALGILAITLIELIPDYCLSNNLVYQAF